MIYNQIKSGCYSVSLTSSVLKVRWYIT